MGSEASTVDLNAFAQACENGSQSVRNRAFEQFLSFPAYTQSQAAVILLKSDYRDLREAVLDFCTEENISQDCWTREFKNVIADSECAKSANLCQGLLVIFQRLTSLEPEYRAFCRQCLNHDDPDVRYQAYCLAELQEDTSEEFVEIVKKNLGSDDEDMRIISIQAVSRLKPAWGMQKLNERAEKAVSRLERFHILLSQIHICSVEDRHDLAMKLCSFVSDGRFAFAAIQALYEFGDSSVVPVLLNEARSLLSEPTTRIAAAAAAAKIGSEDAVKILEKFSKSRHGNPNYAKEQLERLGR